MAEPAHGTLRTTLAWTLVFRAAVPAMLLVLVTCAANSFVFAVPPRGETEAVELPTLWIIGDSTARNGNADGVGWGEVIAQHFDTERIRVQNKAIGGRSSRTFRTEGRWAKVIEEAKPGDFVLMQFGHNDPIAPDDPERPRGTLRGVGDETVEIIHPHTGEPEIVHTFGWYMRQYIREAKEKGMVPIVCSYIPRAPRKGQTPNPELSSYALYAQQVAVQDGAAFIDLYGRVARDYVSLEAETPHSVKEQFFVGGDRDYTHTNRAGAERNAQHVVDGIRDCAGGAGELADYLAQTPAVKRRPGSNR